MGTRISLVQPGNAPVYNKRHKSLESPAKNAEKSDMKGWILLHRKFFEHEFWTENRELSKAEAWIDLIAQARWKNSETTMLIKGREIPFERGQLIASVRFLRKRWQWGSTNKVKRFLDCLESGHMIVKETIQGVGRITICKYDTYQTMQNADEYTDGTQTNTLTEQNRKEGKEGKEGNNTSKKSLDVGVRENNNHKSKKYNYNGYHYQLAEYLLGKIMEFDPTNRFASNPPNLEEWAHEFRIECERYGRTPKEIGRVIQWLFNTYQPKGDFDWRENVQSAKKVRQHYDKLKKQSGAGGDQSIDNLVESLYQ